MSVDETGCYDAARTVDFVLCGVTADTGDSVAKDGNVALKQRFSKNVGNCCVFQDEIRFRLPGGAVESVLSFPVFSNGFSPFQL